MPISEAKKRANKKWNDTNLKDRYDRVQLVVPKGVKAAIEEYAKRHGESVNGLVNRLLMVEMRATPEEWKRGEVTLPEQKDNQCTHTDSESASTPDTAQSSASNDEWLSDFRRIAAKEQAQREEQAFDTPDGISAEEREEVMLFIREETEGYTGADDDNMPF